MNKAILSIVAFAGLILVLAPVAEAASVEAKRTFGLRTKGASVVQLRAVMVPVRYGKSKRPKNAMVTVIFKIRDNSRVGAFCRLGPKLKDALLSAWYKKPLRDTYLFDRDKHNGKTQINYKRTPSQSKEDKRLIRIINKAVGARDVSRIMVVKGAYKMNSSGLSRLPFSRKNGCDEMTFK